MSFAGVPGEMGLQVQDAIKLYFEQIGNKIAGRPIEAIYENDNNSIDAAKSKLEKLVKEDQVDVVNGLLSSRMAHEVAPLADHFKVPIVSPIGASDELTQHDHPRYFLRVSWTASQSAHPFGQWVYEKLGYKRVAIVSVDYQYGWQNAGGFQRTFELAGGEVVQKLWATMGFLDYSALMKKISPDVDAVYLISTWQASDIMAKQFREFGPKVPMIGSGATFDDPVLELCGDDAIGAVSSFSYSAAVDTGANKKFVAAFRAKYNQEPGLYAESGYVSAMWIAKAIESLGGNTDDKARLLDALYKVKLDKAPRGAISLDEYGNPIQNIYVRRVDKVNGKLQNTVIDTFTNVSQFWTWTPEAYMKEPVYDRKYRPCKTEQAQVTK